MFAARPVVPLAFSDVILGVESHISDYSFFGGTKASKIIENPLLERDRDG